METYQPIYDAVRSRIGHFDIEGILRSALDFSHLASCVAQEFQNSAYEQQRPFVLLRPKMFPDGDKWCALYGDNLQEGVAGFGDTPARAASAFDRAWSQPPPQETHGTGQEEGPS